MRDASDLRTARERMINEQLAARDIRDPRVLQAMSEVPREVFVPEDFHCGRV